MVCPITQPDTVSLRRPSEPENVLGGLFPVPTGSRSYSLELGRWINRDPIGENGGENIHAHTANRPVGMVDILGRSPLCPSGDTANMNGVPYQILTDGTAIRQHTVASTGSKYWQTVPSHQQLTGNAALARTTIQGRNNLANRIVIPNPPKPEGSVEPPPVPDSAGAAAGFADVMKRAYTHPLSAARRQYLSAVKQCRKQVPWKGTIGGRSNLENWCCVIRMHFVIEDGAYFAIPDLPATGRVEQEPCAYVRARPDHGSVGIPWVPESAYKKPFLADVGEIFGFKHVPKVPPQVHLTEYVDWTCPRGETEE